MGLNTMHFLFAHHSLIQPSNWYFVVMAQSTHKAYAQLTRYLNTSYYLALTIKQTKSTFNAVPLIADTELNVYEIAPNKFGEFKTYEHIARGTP